MINTTAIKFIKFSSENNKKLYKDYSKEEISDYLLPQEYLDAKGYKLIKDKKFGTWVYEIKGVSIPAGLIPMAMKYIKKANMDVNAVMSDESFIDSLLKMFAVGYEKNENKVRCYDSLKHLCFPGHQYFSNLTLDVDKSIKLYILNEENSPLNPHPKTEFYETMVNYNKYLKEYKKYTTNMHNLKGEKYGNIVYDAVNHYFYFFRIPSYLVGLSLDSFRTYIRYSEKRVRDYEKKYHTGKDYYAHENPAFMYTRIFEF